MSTPNKYEGHTPGPWTQQNKYGVFSLDALGLVKKTICWTALNNNTRTLENEANARLIADAPALLAENERLREALRGCEPILIGALAFIDCNAQLNALRAALAEGKGDQ